VAQLAIRVVLLEPEKEGNIGAIARSMKNFDFDDLWIVNPKVPIDGEARAFAMRGLDILTSARIVKTLDEAIKGTGMVVGTSSIAASSTTNLPRFAITAQQFAQRIATGRGTIAVVFGRESTGLNNREVEACDFIVTIPASRHYNVLNVATAASIVFYEIFQKKSSEGRIQLATGASKAWLLKHFDRFTSRLDIQPHKRKLALRAFRNVISRSFISSREASLLSGVFRRASQGRSNTK